MRLRLLLSALLPLALGACGTTETFVPVPIESTNFAPSLGVNLAGSTKTASGLYIRDIKVGTGATLTSGQTVGVYYSGALANGSTFDARQAPNSPFAFKLGSGFVIKGWDEGVAGMKVGGQRQLVIPAALGYGSAGNGPIPPDAVLVFTIDAVSTTP
jgi:peptidylprolyl isomerase